MNTAWRLSVCAWLVIGLSLAPAAFVAPVRALSCTELIVDGGFEAGGAWQLGPSPIMPQYVTYTRHDGNRSLALGITSGANVASYSSARQPVTIPGMATQATLSFWFYAMAGSPATTDYMEVVLLDATGTSILAKPWYSHNDSRLWNQMSFDLTPWRGQTVQVYLNVYNDGLGGVAAMFLDDVSLTACTGGVTVVPTGALTPAPTGTAAATAAPTVTPSPTPGCTDVLANGDFSGGQASWQTPAGSPGVALVASPTHSAPNAFKLGSLEQNLDGLAWVRQLVTIPAGYAQVKLEAWIYTESQPNPGNDYQQIDLLDASGNALQQIWTAAPARNNPAWEQLSLVLPVSAGQSVFVRFGVFNDGAGGRTDMIIDDVRVTACAPGPGATSTATLMPTGTPTPPATPLPTVTGTPPATSTPLPPECTELLLNSGFESAWNPWYVPWNPLPPQRVAGAGLGGSYAAELGSQTQNASSYSSVRQWVTIPATHPRVVLSFWTFTWAESLTGADRQQFVLLAPDNSVLTRPWSVLENEQTWRQRVYDIIGVAGSTFAVYFNAINDGAGGRTALFVDEAHLWACPPDMYPASLTSVPAAVSAASATAAPASRAAAAAVTAPAGAVTRVALAPPTQIFAGAQMSERAAPGALAEPASLLNTILPPGSLRWLAIILAVILVIVVAWLLWPRRKE